MINSSFYYLKLFNYLIKVGLDEVNSREIQLVFCTLRTIGHVLGVAHTVLCALKVSTECCRILEINDAVVLTCVGKNKTSVFRALVAMAGKKIFSQRCKINFQAQSLAIDIFTPRELNWMKS